VKPARLALAALLLPAVGLALATLLTARRGDRRLHPPRAGEETVDVYVVRNWLHANMVVPAAALGSTGPAAEAAAALPGPAPWLMMGWGDAKHYRERGHTPLRALDLWRSFLAPNNPAVILVSPLQAPPTPETMGKPVIRLTLSRRGFERLLARLNRSFALTCGRPQVAGRGREPDSLFFSSQEGSDLLHVCNHWIAHLLHAAGVPTRPVLDTITAGLAWDLKQSGARDVPGELGQPPDTGLETPPVNSGRFEPVNAEARRTGAVRFEAYAVRFGRGPLYSTEPLALVRASTPGGGGRSYADWLDVPPASLVETRRIKAVEGAGAGPCEAPVTHLAMGFRTEGGKRYEIAIAAFAGSLEAEPCAVLQFRQP
jgi:hypothetical protein